MLGSGGLIGSHLVQHLASLPVAVLQVTNRRDIDLRTPGALDEFEYVQPPSLPVLAACSHAQYIHPHTGMSPWLCS